MIITSADTITWTHRESGTKSVILGLGGHSGLAVASGTGGLILTSTDGITWKSQNSGTSETLWSVSLVDTLPIIVVGSAGTIVSSNDGVKWGQSVKITMIKRRSLKTLQVIIGSVRGSSIRKQL